MAEEVKVEFLRPEEMGRLTTEQAVTLFREEFANGQRLRLELLRGQEQVHQLETELRINGYNREQATHDHLALDVLMETLACYLEHPRSRSGVQKLAATYQLILDGGAM